MDVEITELEKIEADRIDGVGMPANGIPVLLFKQVAPPVAKGARDCPKCEKSYDADHQGDKCENCGAALPDAPASKAADDAVNCPTCKGDGKIMDDKRDCPDCGGDGKVTPAKAKTLAAKSVVRGIIAKAVDRKGNVDEAPDIAGGTAVLAQIADLIISEATELKAGQAGEISDILQLACAAESIWCWRTGEEAVGSGSVMPATALMQSVGEMTPEQDAAFKALWEETAKAKHSADDRRKLAEQGNALSDGSYPIADEEDLKSAAILAQSGHGDVEGARRLIGRRAKELGVKNPLEGSKGDTSKSAVAEGEDAVDTVTQGTGDLEKIVENAVAKAVKPHQERITSLEAELAKVKALPVPGGPVLSRNVQVKTPGGVVNGDLAAKAALYRQKAADATAPADREGYVALARETEQQARTAPAS